MPKDKKEKEKKPLSLDIEGIVSFIEGNCAESKKRELVIEQIKTLKSEK